MAKFPAAHVYSARATTARIGPEMPTVARLTIRTDGHQFVFYVPRDDAIRLARQIQSEAAAAPFPSQPQ